MSRRKQSKVSDVSVAEVDELPRLSEPKPEPQKPVDTRPRITARQMFRASADPIAQAFLHVEGLHQKRTRKLTREEWEAEFKTFRTAERR